MNDLTSIPAIRRAADSQDPAACTGRQNVGSLDQVVSLTAGCGLLLWGLERPRWAGIAGLLAGGALLYRGLTRYCAMYDALGIDSSHDPGRPGVRAKHGQKVVHAIHINRNPAELYAFWKDFRNLPYVMRHLKSVVTMDDQRSVWVARAPGGRTLQWEAELITDRDGEFLAWQSLPGSQVRTAGSVAFNVPASGQGTELVVSLKYDPPGGKLAAHLADFFGQGMEGQLQEDLQNFKQIMESGEVATNAMRPEVHLRKTT